MARVLSRSLLLLLARWLEAWAERLLAGNASATSRGDTEELKAPPHAVDEPPAHWVERVRQSAPELLVGLKLPRPARPRPPPAIPGPTPERTAKEPRSTVPGSTPAWGHRADPRREGGSHQPRNGPPVPDGLLSTPPAPSAATHAPPAGTAPSAATRASPANAPSVPPLFGHAMAASAREGSVAEPRTRTVPARSQAHGVLRWSEHARRTELERHSPASPEPRSSAPVLEAPPEPRAETQPEADELDWVLPPFEELVPEPALDGPAPGRWPELPPETPPGEEAEDLVRRLERQRRMASEQRGE